MPKKQSSLATNKRVAKRLPHDELRKTTPRKARERSLTAGQREAIQRIWAVVSVFFRKKDAQRFERGFLEFEHPEREVRVWSQIASSMSEYLRQFPNATDRGRHDAFISILMLSLGAERPPNVAQSTWSACEKALVAADQT